MLRTQIAHSLFQTPFVLCRQKPVGIFLTLKGEKNHKSKKGMVISLKKILFHLLLAAFIVLGIFLCVYYAKIYAENPAHPMQLALSVICAAEAAVTSVSLYIRKKNINTKYAKLINGASFLLCVQVGLFAFMWLTYFLGIAVDSIS